MFLNIQILVSEHQFYMLRTSFVAKMNFHIFLWFFDTRWFKSI